MTRFQTGGPITVAIERLDVCIVGGRPDGKHLHCPRKAMPVLVLTWNARAACVQGLN